MIPALFSALLLSALDPCAAVAPADTRDPAGALVYQEVGDSERAAGSRDAAVAAYREALRRDPAGRAARTALDALCHDGPPAPAAFQQGLGLMQAGDVRGAIPRLQQARAAGPDPSAALLEGICHYELGEDAAARPLLREAESAPEHRDLARYYLGLVALREGASDEAARLFDAASENPALAHLASDLARVAHRDGKLVLSVLGESGWDSNVVLAPGGFGPSSAEDGTWGVSATGLYRPLGAAGTYLRGSGFLHQQFSLGSYDLGGLDGAAGWQLGGPGRGALAEYDFGHRTFGGSSFLDAHRLLASGWLTAAGATWSATWFGRVESYAGPWDPFSGFLQRGEARATFALGRQTLAGLAYGVSRDATRQAVLDFTEHGPSALLRLGVARRLRLGVDLGLAFRRYGAYDPALSARRGDAYLDAAAFTEYDLTSHLVARVALAGRKAFSNVAAFDYAKLAPTVGLAWIGGW
ncbi:tetratricopeptide repeat protein [Anaeromyxobacter paludicola]|uniref:Tetratricopeptide repeat protein n=1 Tax=Anaeromyxobacter paludicola TaxID=2918171 RepID=A0ABM7XDS8_9BACT|nr:tetratricopeptide repeat protein [Anaeromyxobacter paludicola]BDG10044.1 hypothetical protein AMPC_31570 [Anaeromyxobacter paludicola]